MTIATSRRHFLKLAGGLGALGVGAPLGLNMAAIKAASAATEPDDYKALVCVFLYGGNDSFNTIVPFDTANHANYMTARGPVGIARSELNNTVINPDNAWDGDRQFALNPYMGDLKNVFDQGKLSLMMGVGTLEQAVTLDDYRANRNLPPKLMSHNDQFSLWQSSLTEGATSGWGGRMGDLFAHANTNASLLTNISVGSSAIFSSGYDVQEFALGTSGVVNVDPKYMGGRHTTTVKAAIDDNLSHGGYSNLYMKELVRRSELLKQGNSQLESGLNTAVNFNMPDTTIARQLNLVARIIAANRVIGAKRQIFFVGMGGFDSHQALNNPLAGQSKAESIADPTNSTHPVLLARLSSALAAFQSAIDSVGLGESVTTFTASDFGRSLTSNGRGSDHGWGGHHFIMGGAVKPRSWHGTLPTMQLGDVDDIGQGRLLPSVSVSQYAATLASWMGVPDSDMDIVVPGIDRFDRNNLDFMV